MIRHQTNDAFLRNILLTNVVVSVAFGSAGLLFSGMAANALFSQSFTILGASPANIVLDAGLIFLLFAGFVLHTARQEMLSRSRVKGIIFLDILWVIISAFLLLPMAEHLSPTGFNIILLGAVVTLLFVIEQMVALAQVYQGASKVVITTKGSRMTITASLDTRAVADRVWQVMSDQPGYAEVADNLSAVEILSGEGEGMIRQCKDTKGRAWQETCTRWDDGSAFAFRVHTEAEDYPYPIAELSGVWSLAPTAHGTRIKMAFDVAAKSGVINRLLFKVMAAPFANLCDRLLRKWVQEMEGRPAQAADIPARPGHSQHAA